MSVSRRGRGAFTLLEVMVALVVTSVVVLLAYATLSAATDTEARVVRAHRDTRDDAAARALLADAVRHAVAETRRDGRTWALEQAADGTTSRFTFVTRGIQMPHGASGRWFVSVQPTANGVQVVAAPLDDDAPPLLASLAGVSLSVQCYRQATARWQAEWTDLTRLPDAIAITLMDATGRDVTAPIVARLSPSSAP